MRRIILMSAIAIASWSAAHAAAATGDLYADSVAASKLSLDDAKEILKPWVMGYTASGDVVFKGGTVNGGTYLIANDYEPYAQERSNAPGRYQVILSTDYSGQSGLMSPDTAQRVLNALRRWRTTTSFERQSWNEQKAAEFAAIVTTFRAANPKPVISEDVRRYKIMAEANYRAKRFNAAATNYEAGLKLAPWWPEGHFNAALLLGATGRYSEAIQHMDKYLALVPDAPDARQAQDKIYVWSSGND
jgi:tetratricopeptide (TPR) repeat protein